MPAPLLELEGLDAMYGATTVLHGVNLQVGAGEIVAVLGANGAGKTTLLRAISGMVRTRGHVGFLGTELAAKSVRAIARGGVAHVTEGRGTFPGLTVEENLLVGGYMHADSAETKSGLERVYSYFPPLGRVRKQVAGTLSGGQQQMLAIGRALMRRPRLLLLDEPSLGLAPLVTQQLFEIIGAINAAEGSAILIVEQHVHLAFELARRGYVLAGGRIVLAGDSHTLRNDPDIRRAYLGY